MRRAARRQPPRGRAPATPWRRREESARCRDSSRSAANDRTSRRACALLAEAVAAGPCRALRTRRDVHARRTLTQRAVERQVRGCHPLRIEHARAFERAFCETTPQALVVDEAPRRGEKRVVVIERHEERRAAPELAQARDIAQQQGAAGKRRL